MDKNELRKLYRDDPDFRRYVDACVRTYGHDVEYALESPIVAEYARSLTKGGCNYHESSQRSDI